MSKINLLRLLLLAAILVLLPDWSTFRADETAPQAATLDEEERRFVKRLIESRMFGNGRELPIEYPLPLFTVASLDGEWKAKTTGGISFWPTGVAVDLPWTKISGECWQQFQLQAERSELYKQLGSLKGKRSHKFKVRPFTVPIAKWRDVAMPAGSVFQFKSVDFWATWHFQPHIWNAVNMTALALGSSTYACTNLTLSPDCSVLVDNDPLQIELKFDQDRDLDPRALNGLLWAGWWRIGDYIGISRTAFSNRVLWLRPETKFNIESLQCSVSGKGDKGNITIQISQVTLEDLMR